ncbi:hypothetical protein [Nocardia fluminea]|uniref:Uncharacterized protein n=1 Tax=Nocardia fluminea TaxID=134984 RepID=A0A2N3VA68_9NOCA|nr:hypothetical protein [Nocardia fluminea]PKV78532.1 hypothetical protein ATK86_2905 [Nocardia fluminea]
MSSGPARALTYPLLVTSGTLVVVAAWVPFADIDQLSALAVIALAVLSYTAYQGGLALGVFPTGLVATGTVRGRRVRQQYRLVSRSWLEISSGDRMVWQPVFYEPALSTLTPTDLELTGRTIHDGNTRFYPSGRVRTTEPAGKLVDNPSRPADPPAFGIARRLILDLQQAVGAPLVGLLWVYVMDGGLGAFIAATTVAAATFTWLSAIRGSDPS